MFVQAKCGCGTLSESIQTGDREFVMFWGKAVMEGHIAGSQPGSHPDPYGPFLEITETLSLADLIEPVVVVPS